MLNQKKYIKKQRIQIKPQLNRFCVSQNKQATDLLERYN